MPLKSASSQQCQEVVLNAIFFVRAGLHVSFDDKSLENIFVGIFGKEKFDVDTDEIEKLLRSENSSETIQQNQNYA